VRAALGRLSAEQREPIELAYFDALTQTEIAQLLELPLGTVKSRTFAGLSRLRALLADAELATVPEGRGRDRAPAGAT
jgi:DNA-directed RNA polymerase specialized sigma24 family protein